MLVAVLTVVMIGALNVVLGESPLRAEFSFTAITVSFVSCRCLPVLLKCMRGIK
jgi:hypothetical protein